MTTRPNDRAWVLHSMWLVPLLFTTLACSAAQPQTTVAPKPAPSVVEVDPIDPNPDMVAFEVSDVKQFPLGGTLVLLQEKVAPRRIVPLLVGQNEGRAISLRMSRQRLPRPLTHDLVENILKNYHVKTARVEIDDYRDGIFFASLFLVDADGKVTQIDARPSDSIVFALGINAPIYIELNIVKQLGKPAEELVKPAVSETAKNGVEI